MMRLDFNREREASKKEKNQDTKRRAMSIFIHRLIMQREREHKEIRQGFLKLKSCCVYDIFNFYELHFFENGKLT